MEAIAALREQGIEVYATLAPLLPCDPERLATLALTASKRTLIGDPLHVRQTKRHGATTRAVALSLARQFNEEMWFDPLFQREILQRITKVAEDAGLTFEVGTRGFSRLAA